MDAIEHASNQMWFVGTIIGLVVVALMLFFLMKYAILSALREHIREERKSGRHPFGP